MKKTILILLTVGIAGLSMADFQAPPAEKNGPIRKLSRALSNIVYGVTEIPTQWNKTNREEGGTVCFAGAILPACTVDAECPFRSSCMGNNFCSIPCLA